MKFNIDAILNDMASAIAAIVKDDWQNISTYARQILENEKAALKNLAEQRISGEITDEELDSELEDEKATINAELNALKVVTKAMVEKAVNAALDVLYKAIRAAL